MIEKKVVHKKEQKEVIIDRENKAFNIDCSGIKEIKNGEFYEDLKKKLGGGSLVTIDFLQNELKKINEINYLLSKESSNLRKSYILLNDCSHEYFYNKNHEHIPGVMLIEAQRQIVYDYLYNEGGNNLGEITVSLNKLNCDFFNYAECYLCVEMVLEEIKNTINSNRRSFIINFFQNDKIICRFGVEVSIIKLKRFSLLRRIDMKNKIFLFNTKKKDLFKVFLENGEEVVVEEISSDRIKVRKKYDLGDLRYIFFKDQNDKLKVNILSYEEKQGSLYLKYIVNEDVDKLYNFIKFYFNEVHNVCN
ncbi:AfsA-related hotdog domain-containing protein [Acinetobacter pittii]|uniref:AfsA-related hotdog domain-containing protein n=1 Tax=Acinetobacter pittii TaxID=48296 RepID=UPI003009D10E